MQVFIERRDQENLAIKVGNWGFPFEPLLMKKRFQSNLQRIVNDIANFQELKVDKEQIQQIEQGAKSKKRAAIILLSAVVIGLVFYNIIKPILLPIFLSP